MSEQVPSEMRNAALSALNAVLEEGEKIRSLDLALNNSRKLIGWIITVVFLIFFAPLYFTIITLPAPETIVPLLIVIVCALILPLVVFSLFTQSRLRKAKARIAREASNVPNDATKTGTATSTASSKVSLNPEHTFRLNLIKAWMQDDAHLREALVAMLTGAPHETHDRDTIEKYLDQLREQRKSVFSEVPTWISIASNAVQLILGVSSLVGLIYGLLKLLFP